MALLVRIFLCVASAAAAFNLTAAYSERLPGQFSPDVNEKCFDTADLKLWPVEPESQVCGSDGLLYPSTVALECSNYAVRSKSVREQPRSNCGVDAKPYDPCLLYFDTERKVCGTDNVTHTHIFQMACIASKYNKDIGVQSFGECKINCPRSFTYKPVCTSSGDSFNNAEALKCRQMLSPYDNFQMEHEGLCKPFSVRDPCDELNYSFHGFHDEGHVCASNGRSYAREREVRCLKKTNPSLAILHEGACTLQEIKDIIGLSNVCSVAAETNLETPICGSNNVTYTNAFTFLCASKSSLNEKNELKVAYEGSCFESEKCPNPPVPEYPSLVCGSDGTSYPNINEFLCAQLQNRTLKNVKIDDCFVRTKKNFCSQNSDARIHSFFPEPKVCGSDNVSYVSKQDLLCAAKTKPDLKLLHLGTCL